MDVGVVAFGLGQVGHLILLEVLIGCVFAVLAFGLFSYLETSARRHATLDVR